MSFLFLYCATLVFMRFGYSENIYSFIIMFWILGVFFLRGFIFSRFLEKHDCRNILSFVPFLQFYLFSKNLIDSKKEYINSRVAITFGYIFQYLFFIIFFIALFFPKVFVICDCSDVFYERNVFILFTYLIWRKARFLFNIQYLSILKIFLRNIGVKNKFKISLVRFTLLFVSENLAMLIVLYHYKKNEKNISTL